jgi:transposase
MDESVRVLRPNRAQLVLRPLDFEMLLPADHRARAVWDWVQSLDLSRLYDEIGSVEGGAGRPAIDPALLVALWIYATAEGVGSARALARLCEEHDAYRWLCGGVSVSAHTLSDFRVWSGGRLDELLTQSVGRLMHVVATLQRVAQTARYARVQARGRFDGARAEKCLHAARGEVALRRSSRRIGRVSRAAAAREAAAEGSRITQALAQLRAEEQRQAKRRPLGQIEPNARRGRSRGRRRRIPKRA